MSNARASLWERQIQSREGSDRSEELCACDTALLAFSWTKRAIKSEKIAVLRAA
jgi:hypothetical protein